MWTAGTEELLQVRAASAHDATSRPVFNLWRIAGRKHLAHAGSHLIITAEQGPHRVRASLSTELKGDAACGFAVPLDAHLRTRLLEYQAQARALLGEASRPSARQASRASLLHLHALQALDGSQAGARHRDIAAALFGAADMQHRWTADSELRAQVRHLLTRAQGFMRGGYLALVGLRQRHVSPPGDEAVH